MLADFVTFFGMELDWAGAGVGARPRARGVWDDAAVAAEAEATAVAAAAATDTGGEARELAAVFSLGADAQAQRAAGADVRELGGLRCGWTCWGDDGDRATVESIEPWWSSSS